MANDGEMFSQCTRFFRVIVPHILEKGTLELPRNFVKKHGKRLSKYACLKLPNGAVSRMEVRRCDGRAWLHQGWRDFVDKYSIKYGYFLVFLYKGGSRFNVIIFDSSTSEIDYSEKALKRKFIEVKEEDSVEILNERPHKVQKEQSSERYGATTIARKKVLQRAKVFHSSNPHFIVRMSSTYISRPFMSVPMGPARNFLCQNENNVIYLKLDGEDGRTWSMKYTIGAPPKSVVNICGGWSEFARDNHLQEGDICAFDLVNSLAMVFKVTIFRISNENTDKSSCFTVVMKRSYVEEGFQLHIPYAHASRYLMDQHGNEAFLHLVDGESWPVTCYVNGSKSRFSCGWKDFVVGNDLQEGDACVFELFSQAPNRYNVTISRGYESEVI